MNRTDLTHGFMHILGHPELPLDPEAYPADAQILNCWNFCLLMEHLEIPYCYYGMNGSRLPEGSRCGRISLCGKATGRWKYGNRWHQIYNRRLNRCLQKNLCNDGRPEWAASLYGISQCGIRLPETVPVFEPMVGYDHCWTRCRVFPSYAQQHILYARQPELTGSTRFFDIVIPHFLDPEQYHTSNSHEEYLLYLGRNSTGKGIALAAECAELCGRELKCIHDGCHGRSKADLLAGAYAVMMPTLYSEPFGYVAAEAQLCGTPVICTDWGAFTETVIQGVTGFRCRTQAEFLMAVKNCARLDRNRIAAIAEKCFTITAVAKKYREYLSLLWKEVNSKGYYVKDECMDRSTFLEKQYQQLFPPE